MNSIGIDGVNRLIGLVKALAGAGLLRLPASVKQTLPWYARLTLRFVNGRWGANNQSSPRRAEDFADALTELGPSFVKLGQVLSVRADLIGSELAEGLSQLQDRMKPFPTSVAIATVEKELGGHLIDFFSEFSQQAIAAASIAQVHKARTLDGRDVAVKILRPQIEELFEKDLALMTWVASQIEKYIPASLRLKPQEVVETLREISQNELDLRLEGAAASELAENFPNTPLFHVPQVDWALTGKRVLTLEWIDGVRVDDLTRFKEWGLEPAEILQRASAVFFLQVFRDGFFHADMHPGNVLIRQDGTICPLDFGIMGRLSKAYRVFLADTLLGFLLGDYDRVAEAHFRHQIVPNHKSLSHFSQALRAIGAPLMNKSLSDISIAKLLEQLFQTTSRFDMPVQPELLLLQKTMLVAEGVGRVLNPSVNMWLLSKPLIEDWFRQNFGPAAKARELAEQGLTSLQTLPSSLKHIESLLDRAVSQSKDAGNRLAYLRSQRFSTSDEDAASLGKKFSFWGQVGSFTPRTWLVLAAMLLIWVMGRRYGFWQ